MLIERRNLKIIIVLKVKDEDKMGVYSCLVYLYDGFY